MTLKLSLGLLLISSFGLAAPTKVKTSAVRGDVAAAKFLSFVPVGKYTGTYGSKKETCEVEVAKTKSAFSVDVDGLSTSVFLTLNTQLKESKSSMALVDEEEDGDEANGAYLFTRTARATKLAGGKVKVTTIEEKQYLDKEADDEVEVKTCTIKP